MSCISLQDPDGTLVGIRRVVVSGHTLLEGQQLLQSGLHVGVFLLCLVVEHEATLPERTDGLDALELVRLLARVARDGELVATQIALLCEVVENHILHE